jgi:hypothetical protein
MRFLAALILAGLCGATSAAEYDCRSVAGETPAYLELPVHLTVQTTYSSEAGVAISAGFQIEGDIGYSTTATEPDSLATVTRVVTDGNQLRFSMHYANEHYDGDVATVHLVTLSEGAHAMTGGVLHVVGGGLWTVHCIVTYED